MYAKEFQGEFVRGKNIYIKKYLLPDIAKLSYRQQVMRKDLIHTRQDFLRAVYC